MAVNNTIKAYSTQFVLVNDSKDALIGELITLSHDKRAFSTLGLFVLAPLSSPKMPIDKLVLELISPKIMVILLQVDRNYENKSSWVLGSTTFDSKCFDLPSL